MSMIEKRLNPLNGNSPQARPIISIVIWIGLLALAGVFASPSPLVVLAAGLASILIVISLWPPGELPILLLPILVQFSAVSLKPMLTAFTDASLQELSDYDGDLQPAALFSLAALVGLSFGL